MEILSPASNLKHIEAAIDGKANAVYGGLKKWNARNKAINFSIEEYNYIIEELHKNGIKFFLTLNILMLDEEIEEVIEFLKENKLPDAFIAADIGLIQKLKKEFPNVPLHFSTQFGCHNIDDVNYVQELGGERAILARELTLDEINNIRNNTKIELECFIWGSQCLSFSGLCFFGTLINGGGGNRGKCIITCRDIYSINGEDGNYLYVPDMDCTNLISKLDNIDCLKLEGRRRNPKEIKEILDRINNNIESKINSGYLYGEKIEKNKLYEKINSRIKPVMKASLLKGINESDICIEYKNDKPIRFSDDYENPNVYYVYSEYKKAYDINKKNINLEIKITDNKITEFLYVNYRGDGHTFYSDDSELIPFNINLLFKEVEKINDKINLYKIRLQKNNNSEYYISKNLINEFIDYITKDCKEEIVERKNNSLHINKIYLETQEESIIQHYINDEFVKIIYDIATIKNLLEIEKIIEKYKDKIIYKLPMFNWKSLDVRKKLELLSDKEIMFTRLSQFSLCKNIKFKKKYVDYTIYIWNKESLKYVEENGINEFTASPELSYKRNSDIFDDKNMQVIVCGKLPLVYSRNCFSHLFGCLNCSKQRKEHKDIKNKDKELDFEIFCNEDIRYIVNKIPILNDYTSIPLKNNTTFRYITLGQTLNEIDETIKILKEENYYKKLKKLHVWSNSYECNIIEGKE